MIVRTLTCALLALLVTLAACTAPSDEPGEDEAVADASTRVRVEGFRYAQLPGGERIVTGTLVNPTRRAIRNAMVSVSLYDAHNRRISTLSFEVHDVPAGQRRAFREYVERRDVHAARVRSVMVL